MYKNICSEVESVKEGKRHEANFTRYDFDTTLLGWEYTQEQNGRKKE